MGHTQPAACFPRSAGCGGSLDGEGSCERWPPPGVRPAVPLSAVISPWQSNSLNTHVSTPLAWSSLHECRASPAAFPGCSDQPDVLRWCAHTFCQSLLGLIESEGSFTAHCGGTLRLPWLSGAAGHLLGEPHGSQDFQTNNLYDMQRVITFGI